MADAPASRAGTGITLKQCAYYSLFAIGAKVRGGGADERDKEKYRERSARPGAERAALRADIVRHRRGCGRDRDADRDPAGSEGRSVAPGGRARREPRDHRAEQTRRERAAQRDGDAGEILLIRQGYRADPEGA